MNNIIQKKNQYKLIVLFLFCINLQACTSFLEEPVDNGANIENINELKAALISVLPTPEYLFTDFMTDDYSLQNGKLRSNLYEGYLPIYEFRITKENPMKHWFNHSFNPNYSFTKYYYYIHNSALIISKANALTANGAEEKEMLDNIRGQALAIKAYCHFMLVSIFSKQYNKETAGDDYAPPYISSYSGELIRYTESNVKTFYTNIETDLLASLKLIKDKSMPNDKFYFSTSAVHALLSRFYLHKKEWKKVVKHANIVMGKTSDILDVKKLLTKYDSKDNAVMFEFSEAYLNPDNESYLLMGNPKQLRELNSLHYGFVPNPIYKYMSTKNKDGSKEFTDYLQRGNNFIPKKLIASRPIPLITVDEVYYNRAEAHIQEKDFINAKKDLKFLLSKDNYTDAALAVRLGEMNSMKDKDQLLNFLLESKRMRFFSEGIRWFDMRRHNLTVTHKSVNNIFKIDGNNPMDYVVKIPLDEIAD